MNITRKFTVGIIVEIALTALVAWMGQRWITGFDIRGPFLLMSPLFAGAIFAGIVGTRFIGMNHEEGQPSSTDVDMIRSTIFEFELPQVNVIQQRWGEDLKLVLVTDAGDNKGLPKNWDTLNFDAKRFAIVRTLVSTQKKGFAGIARSGLHYGVRAGAMVLAGCNLWLILACHGSAAVWFGVVTFTQHSKIIERLDAEALRVTKDLKAAITFIKADPANGTPFTNKERRLAALRQAAVRMGIA